MHRALLLSTLCVALLAGCGATAIRGPAVSRPLEETRIVARRTPGGDLELDSYDAGQLFERAYAMTTDGRCLEAIPVSYTHLTLPTKA